MFTAAIALWVAAAPSTKDFEEYARAAQEFEAMVSRVGAVGAMPRITDTRVARLVSTLSDERRFLSSPFPPDPNDRSFEVCSRSTRAVVAYMMSGTGSLAGVDPGTAARRIQAQMAKNTLNYQDELAMLMPFVTRCHGRLAVALAEWVRARNVAGFADVQREGLAQMRLGILQTYLGALISAGDTALKESFRERLLRAAADSASAFSAILTLEGRRSVLQALRSFPIGRTLTVHAARIEKEMSRTDCQGLCAL